MAWERKHYLKKQLFDFDVKGQGPTKVITVCDTPPYGHALTYQINTKGVKLGELWCLMPWLSCFIGGVYRENHRPAASLTNFIRNGVSSNKGLF
jgi:hypothetical protein